jgi:hypothetical protein
MEIDFGFLADAAAVDSSGKLSVLGIFDRIHAAEFPARHGRVSLVLRFSAGIEDSGSRQIEIRLRGPHGQEILRLDGRMELATGSTATEERIRVPHILNLDGISFPEPGRYFFDISADGEPLLTIPLHLDLASRSGASGPRISGPGGASPFAFGPIGSDQA